MRYLDAPIRLALGRTPRELVLLATGAAYCVYELRGNTSWPNFAMYALATAAFAVRFFPARALGVGVALGALAQRLPELRLSSEQLSIPHTWAAVAVIAVLSSRDLEEKFDRAPSPLRWLPNAWAALPARDMRLLRACVYALGALAATLGWSLAGGGLWSGTITSVLLLVALIAVTVLVLLLAAGRAPALLLVPVVCVPIALLAARDTLAAEATLAPGKTLARPFTDAALASAPAFVLPTILLALAATTFAVPYATRLLYQTFRTP